MTSEPLAPNFPAPSNTVADIADTELVRRAVKSARVMTGEARVKHPRWVAVMCAFTLGSTYARQLCRQFDMDPDEMVRRS